MKIKGRTTEETPFAVCQLTRDNGSTQWEFKFYWTANRGTYGYQVCFQVFKDWSLQAEGVTNGCGYDKTAYAFGDALSVMYQCWMDVNDGPSGYIKHIGGNFYQDTIENLEAKLGNKIKPCEGVKI